MSAVVLTISALALGTCMKCAIVHKSMSTSFRSGRPDNMSVHLSRMRALISRDSVAGNT